jgi:hypothetical protein
MRLQQPRFIEKTLRSIIINPQQLLRQLISPSAVIEPLSHRHRLLRVDELHGPLHLVGEALVDRAGEGGVFCEV